MPVPQLAVMNFEAIRTALAPLDFAEPAEDYTERHPYDIADEFGTAINEAMAGYPLPRGTNSATRASLVVGNLTLALQIEPEYVPHYFTLPQNSWMRVKHRRDWLELSGEIEDDRLEEALPISMRFKGEKVNGGIPENSLAIEYEFSEVTDKTRTPTLLSMFGVQHGSRDAEDYVIKPRKGSVTGSVIKKGAFGVAIQIVKSIDPIELNQTERVYYD